ncbi:MAG TPA: arylsulfatase [Thermoguttaceae bacterium]|nr:arylsulfatase [Thermoguttaceae bacterium]
MNVTRISPSAAPARFTATVLVLAILVAPSLLGAENGPVRKPNVVLVMADDMGFSDLGCYGGEIDTPHLDRLAAGGLRFAQFYNTGRCWPTRASLLAGLYPHQAGRAMSFGPSAPRAYSGIIPPACRMIPEVLAPVGYRSYHVGKWHLNSGRGPNETWPLGRGFDRSYFLATQDNYFSPRLVYDENEEITRPGGDYYATEVLSKRAVTYLEQHAAGHSEQPFFLYLAYTAPHFPLHALADDVARFRGKYTAGWDVMREARYRRMRELGIVNCRLSPRDPDARAWDSLSDEEKDEWDARMATYAAMIHCVDRGVGYVVRQLETMGVLDDTLILFLSDNGSSAEYIVRGDGHKPGAPPGSRESYRCLEVGWSNVANAPLRMHKMWMHEGGIATPLIAHWPAGIEARGEITHQVGHVIDVLPTLVDVAGAAYPETFDGQRTTPLPGKSLAPILRGRKPEPREFLFWEHIGNKAVRQGDWKLVAEHRGPWELYDLSVDRSETNDLSGKHPEKVKELAELWAAYADRIGVVDWDTLPGSKRKPSPEYRRK